MSASQLHSFFYPSSIAVVGVSARAGNLGKNIVNNLLAFGYEGRLGLVSPRGGSYRGMDICTSLKELGFTPELVVILTPARTVPALVEEAADLGTRHFIVESGGFGELDEAGRELQERLGEIVRSRGLRLIGPNCIGVICTEAKVAVPFPLLEGPLPQGGLSIVTQSGGVGLTYLHHCAEQGLGIAKFVSVGNKLDVGEAELLEYLLADPATDTVLMYLESIVDGRRLFELIRGAQKPVLVHKANTAAAASSIARSHTAAIANDDAVVSAALAQAGAIRPRTVAEAIEIAKGLALPRPRGRRIAVVSRSGGHAVVAADAIAHEGLELADVPRELLEEVARGARAGVIGLQNPVDLGDVFDFELYKHLLEQLMACEQVDAVVFVHGYRGPETAGSRKLVAELGRISREADKPLAACLLTSREEAGVVRQLCQIPLFPYPEQAVMALARAADWVDRPKAVELSPCAGQMPTEALRRIARCHRDDGWLELPEALHLIKAAGVRVADFVVATTAAEAEDAARVVGLPAVVKAVGPLHKSEVGGVRLGLASHEQVRSAAQELLAMEGVERVVVMRELRAVAELIVGLKRDPAFGPVVVVGMGGVWTELLGDVAIALAPVDDGQAGRMVDGLKAAALLKGYRGRPKVARAPLLEAIMRISAIGVVLEEVEELEVNPLMAGEQGVVAVDGRVRVRVRK